MRQDAKGPRPLLLEMVRLPGRRFGMGSNKHYPEEAPAHRVTVDPFWIDRHPVTNRQFSRFVKATGHATFAEIPPDPKDYPGALPHMLYAGSLVFQPPAHPIDLHDWRQWCTFLKGPTGGTPYGAKSNTGGLDNHPGRARRIQSGDIGGTTLSRAADIPRSGSAVSGI